MPRKRTRQRAVIQRILILCEGQTEKVYLLGLKSTLSREKQRGIRIEIENYKKSDPRSLIDEASRRKRKAKNEGAPYDRIWVVFDHDNLPNRAYAFHKAKKEGIHIGFSAISIELWFIYHFEYTTKSFSNGDQAKAYLGKKYLKPYIPGKPDIYQQISARMDTALLHAEKLRTDKRTELTNGNKEYDLNPYLTIDRLILYMLNL